MRRSSGIRLALLAAWVLSAPDAPAAALQPRSVLSSGGSHAAGGIVSLSSNVGDVISGVTAPAPTVLWSGFYAPWPLDLVGVEPAHVATAPYLRRIMPDPARVQASIAFGQSEIGPLRLELFDLTGRRVRMLQDGPVAVGEHTRVWDLRSDGGSPVGAGIYFVRLTTKRSQLTQRMVVIR